MAVGDKLAEAWHAASFRAENTKQCWNASVVAIEAVLQPVVSPRNPGAGFGVMCRDIKAAPQKCECELLTAVSRRHFLGSQQRIGERNTCPGRGMDEAPVASAKPCVHPFWGPSSPWSAAVWSEGSSPECVPQTSHGGHGGAPRFASSREARCFRPGAPNILLTRVDTSAYWTVPARKLAKLCNSCVPGTGSVDPPRHPKGAPAP